MHRRRGLCAAFALLAWLLCSWTLVPGAAANKKLLEWGWDEPDAAFIRAHITQMEAMPFDGFVYHLSYAKPNGEVGNFSWECWGKRAFTRAELQPSLEDFKATQFRRFRHNFLRFNANSAGFDWFDDFSAVVSNARLAAWFAKQTGSRGVLLDPEHYLGPNFNYREQRHAKTRSWEQYAAQARRCGRQVMEAFQLGYPDLTVFLSVGYSMPWEHSMGRALSLDRSNYGLYAPFLDGMVEATRGKTRLVEGYGLAYPERKPQNFPMYYRRNTKELLPVVADPVKYSQVFSMSFGIWLDNDWRQHGWNSTQPELNYRTPDAFGPLVRKALETADEFVWIYTEKPLWWTAEGRPVRLPKAYETALWEVRRGLALD